MRVTRGTIFDVVVDLRPGSATYREWIGLELGAATLQLLYIDKGLAQGFQTLSDDTEIFYQMSTPYHPESARGIRWNDPCFSIEWPLSRPTVISNSESRFEDFVE